MPKVRYDALLIQKLHYDHVTETEPCRRHVLAAERPDEPVVSATSAYGPELPCSVVGLEHGSRVVRQPPDDGGVQLNPAPDPIRVAEGQERGQLLDCWAPLAELRGECPEVLDAHYRQYPPYRFLIDARLLEHLLDLLLWDLVHLVDDHAGLREFVTLYPEVTEDLLEHLPVADPDHDVLLAQAEGPQQVDHDGE